MASYALTSTCSTCSLPLIAIGIFVALAATRAASHETCDASCPPDIIAGTGANIYSGGASAQTYKPGAPIKTTICDTSADSSERNTKHRVARWPLTRRSYPSSPTIKITGRIHSCDGSSSSSSTSSTTNTCASSADSSNNRPITVEAWQARPDGTYSSLRSGVEEGQCRATIAVGSDSSFHVETLAPGSVGMFSGIGPHGMDLPPYGPPVVNFFIRSQGHAPLLGNIPISSKSFYGPDLRRLVVVGSGGSKNGDASAQITSWNAGKNGDISISIDFFLATRPSDGATSSSDDDSTSLSNVVFCPSWFHVSFFAEPVALCAPSLLDFFEL